MNNANVVTHIVDVRSNICRYIFRKGMGEGAASTGRGTSSTGSRLQIKIDTIWLHVFATWPFWLKLCFL